MKGKRLGQTTHAIEVSLGFFKAVRGKYYRRLLKEGANVVILEPDVADAFRDSASVNAALRFAPRCIGSNSTSHHPSEATLTQALCGVNAMILRSRPDIIS